MRIHPDFKLRNCSLIYWILTGGTTPSAMILTRHSSPLHLTVSYCFQNPLCCGKQQQPLSQKPTN